MSAEQVRNFATCTLCQEPTHVAEYGCKSCNYRCKNCDDAMYCGAECFETDEEMHSLICESIQNLSPQRLRDEKENEVVMVRALLFPEKADKPKFVWVGVKGDNPVGLVDHLGTPPVEIKFASLFSDKRVNTVRDRELKDVVKVYIQGHLEGLEDNTSILQVITLSRRWLKAEAIARAAEFTSVDGTRKRSPEREEGVELSNCYCTLPMRQPTERVELNDAVIHPWKGNAAFMIYRGPHEQDLPHFRDINSTDFRDIVDFLSVCQGHELQDVGYSHRSHRAHKLSFVHVFTKLFQDGSKFKLRRHFVPQDHPFVCEKGLSGDWGKKLQVGEHIDIPMYLVSPHDHLRSNMFLNTTSTSQSPDDPDFDENGLVLRRTFDPWDNATSSSTDLWEAGYGNLNQFSTVLVREDRMHLRIIDAKMIIKWVQRKIIPRMEGDLEPYRNAEGRPVFPSDRESHRLMNKWSFHQYWHEEERIRLESPEVLECGFQYAGYKRDTCQYDLAMYQKD